MSYYKPRAELELFVPPWGAAGDTTNAAVWKPKVLSLRWTKNSHLAADELHVTVHWNEGGVDPRMIKHARCRMWFWDDARESFDEFLHLRFTGICKKATRRLSGNEGFTVELMFHDYTTFFLMMKPFPTPGMPEYSDTLETIWGKICDNTGYRDISTGKIVSNVSALKKMIRVEASTAQRVEQIKNKTLGDLVTGRFHRVAKPTPKNRGSAWDTWQWCVQALGLISYIDRGEVVITDSSEHFKEESAGRLIYGQNILNFEETVDTHVTRKGILGKSFNTLTGQLIEASYPPPNDPFIKKSRAAVKRVAKGTNDAQNETAAEYEEYNFPGITSIEALENAVAEAWEQFSRQEMKGKITTHEMNIRTEDGELIDILSLRAGDCIRVGMDEASQEILKHTGSETEKLNYLMSRTGYIRPVAELVLANIGNRAFSSPIFHVETLSVQYEWGKFEVEIAFHNRVNLTGNYRS